jgi:hypothetical protein
MSLSTESACGFALRCLAILPLNQQPKTLTWAMPCARYVAGTPRRMARHGGRDVWARIQTEALPYLARYDDAPDRIRERSEEIWMGVDCWRWGMAADIRRRDPAQWSGLIAKYPGLAREI